MKQKDYLEHLDESIESLTTKIEDLKEQLVKAVAARDHFLEYAPSKSSQNHQKIKQVSDSEESGRKGLRSNGRARDLFQFFYKASSGATVAAAAKSTGYDVQAVKMFTYRYMDASLLRHDGEKYYLTNEGRELVDRSQAYTGTWKG